MRFYAIVFAPLLALIAACGDGAVGKSEQPKAESKPSDSAQSAPKPEPVDLSTPDRAVKSYWALIDGANRAEYEILNKLRVQRLEARKPLAAVTTANYNDQVLQGELEVFARDILAVKVESESRAVVDVVIRNVTPVPPGAVMSKYTNERRTQGDRYRYILEKHAQGWLLAEAWSHDEHLGTKKTRPADKVPYIPSLTYEGY